MPPTATLRLARLYPGAVYKAATRQVLVPVPTTKGIAGEPLRDTALIDWVTTLIETVIAQPGANGRTQAVGHDDGR